MKHLVLALFLICSFHCFSQEVKTFLEGAYRVDDAMIFDTKGNMYGSHYNGQNVHKISPTGEVSVFASGFNTPNGLAFNSMGHLYVCDNRGNRIYVLDEVGQFIDTVFISNPSGIIKSRYSDTMIFSSYAGNSISYLSPDGNIELVQRGGALKGPVAMVYDDKGVLYVGNYTDRKVYKLVQGQLEYVAVVPGSNSGNSFLGFITYHKGLLWAASFNANKIYKVYPNAIDSVELYSGKGAGSTNGPLSEATYTGPNGITPSIRGDTLFVSEYPSGRIRMIVDGPSNIDNARQLLPSWQVYPNPAQNRVRVQCEDCPEMIKVYDMNGLEVMSQRSKELDLSNFAKGIYFIEAHFSSHMGRKLLVVN